MTISIDQLLEQVEDKDQNPTTTSHQFKRDLWEFFQGFDEKNAVEFGTHKGQTTRILSYLFNQVITFNLPGHFDMAERLNGDRGNITYVGINLYDAPVDAHIPALDDYPVSMFMIDAVHTFDAVMSDFTRSNWMPQAEGDVYFVFDDYGLYRDVWQAVNQLIIARRIERVRYIGHPPGHVFSGGRKLDDHEGIICKLC